MSERNRAAGRFCHAVPLCFGIWRCQKTNVSDKLGRSISLVRLSLGGQCPFQRYSYSSSTVLALLDLVSSRARIVVMSKDECSYQVERFCCGPHWKILQGSATKPEQPLRLVIFSVDVILEYRSFSRSFNSSLNTQNFCWVPYFLLPQLNSSVKSTTISQHNHHRRAQRCLPIPSL